jgi:hypothetical protein
MFECESGRSTSSSAEVKNDGAILPLPYMCSRHNDKLKKHRENVTLLYNKTSSDYLWTFLWELRKPYGHCSDMYITPLRCGHVAFLVELLEQKHQKKKNFCENLSCGRIVHFSTSRGCEDLASVSEGQ